MQHRKPSWLATVAMLAMTGLYAGRTAAAADDRAEQPQPASVTAPADPLHAPVVQAAASANAMCVKLSWSPAGAEPTAFLVERSVDGSHFVRVGMAPGDSTTCTDIRALSPDTEYWYRLVAWNKSSSATSMPVRTATSSFHVFDALLYAGKPDLSQWGIEPIHVAYESEFFATRPPVPDEPDEMRTRQVARRTAQLGQILVFDIEKWRLDIRTASPDVVRMNMGRFVRAIGWIRSEAPTVKLGIYGELPIRELAAPASRDPELTRNWHEANAFLMPLAQAVDYIFPSVYTFENSPEQWERYARANIQEARQYGKPVYPFIWMNYHEHGEAGPQIDGPFWKQQLETLRSIADGIVIWGGYQEKWNLQAPWWIATHEFVRQPATQPAAQSR